MNKKKKEDVIMLTPGSKYAIRSLESRDKPLVSSGTFRGYTVIAGDDAVCIELDDTHEKLSGKLRIIPTHMIMAIDVVKAAAPEDRSDEDTAKAAYG